MTSVVMIYCNQGQGMLRVKSSVRLTTDKIICQWWKCRTGKVLMSDGMCLWYRYIGRTRVDPGKINVNPSFIQTASPYRAVNRLRLGYTNQSVNVV